MTYNQSIARNFVRYSPTIPQMNKFKFILVNNCEKFEKGLWPYLMEGTFLWHENVRNSRSHRRVYWWEEVVNLFWHVTAFNQSDYSIDQWNCKTVVTCKNKFTTPPHQYESLSNVANLCNFWLYIALRSRNQLSEFFQLRAVPIKVSLREIALGGSSRINKILRKSFN